MKTPLRSLLAVGYVIGALLAFAVPSSAQDVALARRQPPACPVGQFAYYKADVGVWYCTTVGPKVPLGASDVVNATTGFAVASMNDSTSTASGTVQNTEYTLNAVTLKANAFDANTRGVQCEAWGALAANANAKNLKFYFGSTSVVTVTGSTANAKDYRASIIVLRKASNAQTGVGSIQVDTAVAPTMAQTASLAQTDGADIVVAFKSANTAAAAASATGNGMSCKFLH